MLELGPCARKQYETFRPLAHLLFIITATTEFSLTLRSDFHKSVTSNV
jgi:hypothetical protein